MEIGLVLTVGAMCIGCFVVGARVGQQAAKGEKIRAELPSPVKAVRDHKARKDADRERSRMEAILANIERYDGSPGGQEDIPK